MQHSFWDYITGQAMLPPRGSNLAEQIDITFLGIYWLSQVLFWGITIAAVYFAWRFRYKPGRVTPHQTHNTMLEVVWTVVPLLICVGLFFWGMNGYMKAVVAPGDAMEIGVTAKQWLWEFTYPDGSKTINDLHLPINRPAKFVMTSDDVLHSFFVPDMRVKMDIVPGRYTQLWFTPIVMGQHTLTCAEYCGKDHSGMKGILTVESEEDFRKFVATGGTEWEDYAKKGDWAGWGALQYKRKGCESCHSIDGSKSKGPSWKGLYGKSETLADGKTVVVDDAYIQESIYNPSAKVVKDYQAVMPTFQGAVKNHELKGLIEYIKTLK